MSKTNSNEIEKIQKIMCSNCTDLCLEDESRYGICTLIVKDLLDKFRIISRSDNPEKWVEVTKFLGKDTIRTPNGYDVLPQVVKLKWRGQDDTNNTKG